MRSMQRRPSRKPRYSVAMPSITPRASTPSLRPANASITNYARRMPPSASPFFARHLSTPASRIPYILPNPNVKVAVEIRMADILSDRAPTNTSPR